MIVYLTIEDILRMQRRQIDKYGGGHGVLSMETLETALSQPRQAVFGQDLYPTVPEKAAILAFLLCQNHPFIDGNKRIALHSLTAMLDVNDFELVVSLTECENKIMEIAQSLCDHRSFSAWVRENSRKIHGRPMF